MSQHQLRHKNQAKATFTRLHEMMKKPEWGKNDEAKGFLKEAETLIEGNRKEDKK